MCVENFSLSVCILSYISLWFCFHSLLVVFVCIQLFQLSALFFFCSPSGNAKNIENLLNAGREEWMVMVFPIPKAPDLQMLLMRPQPVS